MNNETIEAKRKQILEIPQKMKGCSIREMEEAKTGLDLDSTGVPPEIVNARAFSMQILQGMIDGLRAEQLGIEEGGRDAPGEHEGNRPFFAYIPPIDGRGEVFREILRVCEESPDRSNHRSKVEQIHVLARVGVKLSET